MEFRQKRKFIFSFVSDREGVRDLYLMDADGGNVEKIFKQSARREHPTWAPDGKQIAYERGEFIYIATIGKQTEELVAYIHKRLMVAFNSLKSD